MTFADKLKDLRKSKNMSQEQLAEKLYVSRQAITKWENGTGLPDIPNIVAIGTLFNISLDDMLSEEKSLLTKHEFLYESKTEYDLDEEKKLDIKIGTAHEVIIEKTSAEKIQIMAASNSMNYLSQQVKIKIEERSKIMDVEVKHSSDLTDLQAREALFIFIKIPECFVAHMEISGIIENLKVRDIQLDNLEFGGKLKNGSFTNCSGHIELDTFSDLNVLTDGFKGKIDFNQINASSVLQVKNGTYYLRKVGTSCKFLNKDGKQIELAKSRRHEDLTGDKFSGYDFIVEIAGWRSELQIM